MIEDISTEKQNGTLESIEGMERRHRAEVRELEGKVRALLKTAKKSNKAAVEAQSVQMEFDLKARHREEMDQLEEQIGLPPENHTHRLLLIAGNPAFSSMLLYYFGI
jgi:hypothetical protein